MHKRALLFLSVRWLGRWRNGFLSLVGPVYVNMSIEYGLIFFRACISFGSFLFFFLTCRSSGGMNLSAGIASS